MTLHFHFKYLAESDYESDYGLFKYYLITFFVDPPPAMLLIVIIWRDTVNIFLLTWSTEIAMLLHIEAPFKPHILLTNTLSKCNNVILHHLQPY